MISRLQRTVALCCICSYLTVLAGCGAKPKLRVQDVQRLDIHTSAGSQTASPKQIEKFIAAYERARILSDDIETTHELRVDVVLASGNNLVIWGGEAGFQTLAFLGRQLNLQGNELREFLLTMGARKVEPDDAANGRQSIRSETNRTSSAADSRR
jgi:hypothetical protein